ncbi:hypothetical protein M422DRAFT_265255 [Sphaerobolus stellatus SS14]|uniref:Uncharacterized protein n=1 Tax=Sphaerobolus stellatus (strain SS14) TaxID=990650 RepID=A0A0C9V629_SPHS4|nr:hypothetical protein M422DRAFT_265255 [Sphaerobolus stellatus SS14]
MARTRSSLVRERRALKFHITQEFKRYMPKSKWPAMKRRRSGHSHRMLLIQNPEHEHVGEVAEVQVWTLCQ